MNFQLFALIAAVFSLFILLLTRTRKKKKKTAPSIPEVDTTQNFLPGEEDEKLNNVLKAPKVHTDQLFLDLKEEDKLLFRDEQRNGFVLVIEEGNPRGKVIPLIGSEISVGRAISSDVALNDPMISDKHFILHFDVGTPPRLEDLGSTNGTFVNDKRVKTVVLKDQDSIQVGSMCLCFKIETADG